MSECPICYEEKENLIVLHNQTNHTVCSACLEQLKLKYFERFPCPHCRKSINCNTLEKHKLYPHPIPPDINTNDDRVYNRMRFVEFNSSWNGQSIGLGINLMSHLRFTDFS